MSDRKPDASESWQMERDLLGSLMLIPDQLDEVRALVTPRDFHRPQHARLFALICGMVERGETVDVATVLTQVLGREDDYGDAPMIRRMPQSVVDPANAAAYALHVARFARTRQVRLALEVAMRRVVDREDVGEVLADLQRATAAASDVAASPWQDMPALCRRSADDVFSREPDRINGVRTGLTELDELLWGLKPGQLVIVGARPAMGKSALGGVFARNAGVPVGIVSLEMGATEWIERLACADAGVDAGAVMRGRVGRDERAYLEAAYERLAELPIYVDDAGGQSLARIQRSARRLVRDRRARMLIVDYLQLVAPEDARVNLNQAVTQISAGLKALAKELEIPVIALCQLNRGPEDRTNHRASTRDLRDSGSIEQDANVIIFPYRDEVYDPETADKGVMELHVAKNRGGRTGTVRVACDLSRMRITDLARADVETWHGRYS